MSNLTRSHWPTQPVFFHEHKLSLLSLPASAISSAFYLFYQMGWCTVCLEYTCIQHNRRCLHSFLHCLHAQIISATATTCLALDTYCRGENGKNKVIMRGSKREGGTVGTASHFRFCAIIFYHPSISFPPLCTSPSLNCCSHFTSC